MPSYSTNDGRVSIALIKGLERIIKARDEILQDEHEE